MEQRNLEKALDVYAALITGQEISRSNPDTLLYGACLFIPNHQNPHNHHTRHWHSSSYN